MNKSSLNNQMMASKKKRILILVGIIGLAISALIFILAAQPAQAVPSMDLAGWPPSLVSSYKASSQKNLAPGEVLTYTIHLINSSTITEVVTITDPIPVQLVYIPGTATVNAVYDEATHTLTWKDIFVRIGDEVELSFQVNIYPGYVVEQPEVVTNIASITYDEVYMQRKTDVILNPTHVEEDDIQPEITDLTIGSEDVISDPSVTLFISATDNISVDWMYIKEWVLRDLPKPHWEEVQQSGWIPFQTELPWKLTNQSVVHFIGAWVADGNMNRSHNGRAGLDFVSLVIPDTNILTGGMIPYMVFFEKGQNVEIKTLSSNGDVDLYVWRLNEFNEPYRLSTGTGVGEEKISFTAEISRPYLIIVQGMTDATFDLSISPLGGPSAWSTIVVNEITKEPITFEPLLSQSGLSPLALEYITPAGGPYYYFLPAVGR